MLEPEDRKEITDSFRYELGEKIDPLVKAVEEIGERTIDHVDRLSAHKERIKGVERDVDVIAKGLVTTNGTHKTDIDGIKESHKKDFTRVLIIVISALVTILAAVLGVQWAF